MPKNELKIDELISESVLFDQPGIVEILVGSKVEHELFGEGKIVGLAEIDSGCFRVEVEFENLLFPAIYFSSSLWVSGFKFMTLKVDSDDQQGIRVIDDISKLLESCRIEKKRLELLIYEVEKARVDEIENARIAELAAINSKKLQAEHDLELARAIELEKTRQMEEQMRTAEVEHNKNVLNLNEMFSADYISSESIYHTAIPKICSEEVYEQIRNEFVKNWVNSCISSDGFQSPDPEQIKAIATVNGHIQVIARAGSGKTSTLVHRTLFLMKHCRVNPQEILLLAFNRRAAMGIRKKLLIESDKRAKSLIQNEIKYRILESGNKKFDRAALENKAVDAIAIKLNITMPHVMTFHALAYRLVHPEEGLLFDGRDDGNQALSRTLQAVIDDQRQNPDFQAQIKKLMMAHFLEDWERLVAGGYDLEMKDFLQFRRSMQIESLGGEYVKSFGEKIIANFLFEYDIPYKYERNHWWGEINYHPDFTIFKNAVRGEETGIIIEYFGMMGERDYDEMSEEKRRYWASKPRWTLLEFFPRDLRPENLQAFEIQLKAQLERNGVRCIKLSEEEIWLRTKDRAIDRFTKAMVLFVGRCRKRSLAPDTLREVIDAHRSLSPVEGQFLELGHLVFTAYLDRLRQTGMDDFDGLLQRATDAVEKGQVVFEGKVGRGDLSVLRYLCIDEYQDFSELFYHLLSAIRKRNSGLELFCVGDNWQAINGFAGSELRFFENFPDYIGTSRRLSISTNFRSPVEIVEIGNALMFGLGIPAVAHKGAGGEVLCVDMENFEPSKMEKTRHPGDSLTPALLRIIGRELANGLKIVLLCRRNSVPWFINYQESCVKGPYDLACFLEHIRFYLPKELRDNVTISTAHSYKGDQRPVVIVMDAIVRSYPLIHPDWVFMRVHGDNPVKIAQEERRLLYVALTRAQEKLFVITEGKGKSPFLEDLEQNRSLSTINWIHFPHVFSGKSWVMVEVGNQSRANPEATIVLKEQLKVGGFSFHQRPRAVWVKSFPVEGFSIETIQKAAWCKDANGVEVRILDELENMRARFFIDRGSWRCLVNQLDEFLAQGDLHDMEVEDT